MKKVLTVFSICIIHLTLYCQITKASEDFFSSIDFDNVEFNGFYEARAGLRTQKDAYEKDISIMENRFQSEFFIYTEKADFKYKGDVWGDGITEKIEYTTREAWVFSRPTDFMDIKIGRQILTWGTGDLVFLNDLFPKDWQSFFMGRDKDYLKSWSDAAKLSLFTNLVNINLVYTPKFNSDKYITGDYISYWNEQEKRVAGQDLIVNPNKPNRWFYDDEIALRVYKNINNYEYALYGYWGFLKKPGGKTALGEGIFPKLNVYGYSMRGQLGSGIGNMEVAYYCSIDDVDGENSLIDNSEMRYLAGYAQEIAKELNISLQYYVEQILNYGNYSKDTDHALRKDRYRHVITLQLTKLLLNQNLELEFSAYYSPSDQDAYLLPNIHYKYSDQIGIETGANIFCGNDSHTFFAQFENNSNIYVSIRYSF